MFTTTTTTTTTVVADVRRGDVIIDGAGSAWAVEAIACPMDDTGVFFTFEGSGTFRYLAGDLVEVAA